MLPRKWPAIIEVSFSCSIGWLSIGTHPSVLCSWLSFKYLNYHCIMLQCLEKNHEDSSVLVPANTELKQTLE